MNVTIHIKNIDMLKLHEVNGGWQVECLMRSGASIISNYSSFEKAKEDYTLLQGDMKNYGHTLVNDTV